MKMFSRRRNLSDTGHFSLEYMAGSSAPCATVFGKGVGERDKNIDTREACWVSAIGSGHGGIGEEDRALSCLTVHGLCMHNINWRVCLFACLRSHRECKCFYPLSCLGLMKMPYWLDHQTNSMITVWSQERPDLDWDHHAFWLSCQLILVLPPLLVRRRFSVSGHGVSIQFY